MSAAPAAHLYAVSLHDALPISAKGMFEQTVGTVFVGALVLAAALSLALAVVLARHLLRPLERIGEVAGQQDRKRTRLNPNHLGTSYCGIFLEKTNERTDEYALM